MSKVDINAAGPSSRPSIPLHEGRSGMMDLGEEPLSGSSKGPNMHAGMSVPGYRRLSRFDPMDPSGEDEDDGYGDLGSRHPLRRVQEEGRVEGMSLPSLKSLFGPPDRSNNSSPGPSQFQNSLQPLVSPSPSSPSTAYRTSRYSSLGSSFSTISETGGWWAPEYEGGSQPSSHLLTFAPHASRAQSFPTVSMPDDRDAKRRRSDQPMSSADAEEAARLRYQSQSRNASFPASASASISSASTLRSIMAPPMSNRGSISYADDRRPSQIPRSASIVGGHLARSFADLTAADRAANSRSPSMGPPVLPPPSNDRRPSLFPPAPLSQSSSLPLPPEDNHLISPGIEHARSPGFMPVKMETSPLFRRQSVTRPPSPEREPARRSSLTEIIKAKTGDDVAMASGRNPGHLETGVPEVEPMIPDEEPTSTPSMRGIKRGAISAVSSPTHLDDEEDMDDGALGPMDVLAESARRISEADVKDEDRESSPSRAANGGMVGPKYACAFCSKTFSRPSSLRIHTYSHTGERPFVCQEPSCRRRFSVQSNLKRHSKVHQLGVGAPDGYSRPVASGRLDVDYTLQTQGHPHLSPAGSSNSHHHSTMPIPAHHPPNSSTRPSHPTHSQTYPIGPPVYSPRHNPNLNAAGYNVGMPMTAQPHHYQSNHLQQHQKQQMHQLDHGQYHQSSPYAIHPSPNGVDLNYGQGRTGRNGQGEDLGEEDELDEDE